MNEEEEPSWLSGKNDHLHRKAVLSEEASESEPLLFGSGPIPLEGEVKTPTPMVADDDEEAQSGSNNKYGSLGNTKEASSVASSSTRDNSNKKKKSKQSKKKKTDVPPKSIFDEYNNTEPFHDDDKDDSSVITGDDTHTALTLDTKPHMPKRNWCVEYFRVVSTITGISSLGLLATQMIPLFFAPLKSQGYFDLALKFYVSLFCILFLLVESNAPIPFLRNSPILQTFISRGFLYSFLGLICLEEAYSERVKTMVSAHADQFHVAWASLFMQISAWLIFGCGIWYMLMGFCCLKRLRDRVKKKDRQVWTKYRKDLKEWKRMN